MKEILNTGERILLEKETPLMIARHFSAYRFAYNYAKGKNVLDIGCGEGYGSHYLADTANTVMGIDYDKDAIAYAQEKYKRQNLKFLVMNVKDLPVLKENFGLVCSFQNIEHIADTASLLTAVAALLLKNGTFICSTPNKSDASPGSDIPFNKFHVKEYSSNEFINLLKPFFKTIVMYGLQRSGKLNFHRKLKKSGILKWLPETINPVTKYYRKATCDSFILKKDGLSQALDFIALCQNPVSLAPASGI